MRKKGFSIIVFLCFLLSAGCLRPESVPVDEQLGDYEPQKDAVIYAGAAKEDITPDLIKHKVKLAGYNPVREATKVHQPLFVRVVVLKAGKEKIGIISFKQLIITSEIKSKIEEKVRDLHFTGFIIQATHTHSGEGHFWNNWLGESLILGSFQAASLERRILAAERALRIADSSLEKARFVYEKTEANFEFGKKEISFTKNRRSENGNVDKGLERLLIFSTEDNFLIAQLIHFTAHPTILGRDETWLSGDWSGVLSNIAEKEFANSCALVMTGALGDAEPVLDSVYLGGDRFENKTKIVEEFSRKLYSRFYSRYILQRKINWEKTWQAIIHNSNSTELLSLQSSTWERGKNVSQTNRLIGKEKKLKLNYFEVEDNPGVADLYEMPWIFFPVRFFLNIFGSAFWFSAKCKFSILEIGNFVIAGVPGEPSMLHSIKFRKFARDNGYVDGWYLSHCNGWFGYVLDEENYINNTGTEEAFTFYGFDRGDKWLKIVEKSISILTINHE